MAGTDDLAGLMVPKAHPALRYGQGRILAWDPDTFANVVDWNGVRLQDVPVFAGVDALAFAPGTNVALLGWDATGSKGVTQWFILGRLILPGQGFQLTAGRIPGERIATDIETADTTASPSEIVAMSVAAAVETGRIYRVRFAGRVNSSVSTDRVVGRIREDSISGTILQVSDMPLSGYSATFGHTAGIEVEYTADATESKTFVFTTDRGAGTGNVHVEALSTRPAYFYVDYIRG